jgi:molecular chaperone HtpG
VAKLRKQLVKRLLDHLLKLASSNDEAEKKSFAAIDETFGAVLREGLVNDHEQQDRLSRLARWHSTHTVKEGGARTSLEDYVRRMPAGQNAIYVVVAASLDAAKASPHLEACVRKGYEVLFLTDPVDEFVALHLHEFDKHPLTDITKGGADLASAEEKKELEKQAKKCGDFLGFCKEALGEGISEVRLSNRLTDSPCCLVGDAHAVSPQMEEMLRRMGQAVPKQQRALELNPNHPLFAKLQALHAGDEAQKARLKDHLAVLRDQALVAEGAKLADPAAFARRVQALLAEVG